MKDENEKIDHSMPSDFENEFSDLLCDDDIEINIKLYRMKKIGTKTKAFYLRAYLDDVPTYELIKQEFGGGHFKLYTLHPKTEKPITRQLYIEDYTPIHNSNSNNITIEQIRELIPVERPDNSIKIIKDVIECLKPIFSAQSVQAAPVETQSAAMESMMSIFTSGIQKMGESMISTKIKAIKETNETPLPALALPGNATDAEEKNINWFGEIKGVLEIVKEMGDSFLNANPIKSKVMKSAIMNSDVMQEAQKSQELANLIYTTGVNDPEIGEEKTNKLFKKLGFEIEDQKEAA